MGNPRSKKRRKAKQRVISEIHASSHFAGKFPQSAEPPSPDAIKIYQQMADRAEQRSREERQRQELAREKAQKEHNDRIAFKVTWLSTFVAVVAAVAAVWSGLEAHKARIEDERPYLSFSVLKDSNKEGPLRITGLGKAPSLQVHISCVFGDRDNVNWHAIDSVSDKSFFQVVMPGDTFSASCMAAEKQSAGTAVYGLIQYQDAEHHEYQTPFCYEYFGETPAESIYVDPCPEGPMKAAPPFR
jgi:hypothetical protein